MSKSLFIVERIRNKYTILPLRCRLLYFHKLGINRTDLRVVLRGSPTRLNINQYFRPTNPLMIIVSSWAGNAPVVNCYLWERNGGVRRCSVIWKQFESVVGGTTHCTRRSVLSNPELVLHVHVLSGHWTEYFVDWLNKCLNNETWFYFEKLRIQNGWLQTLSSDRIWLLTKSS